MFQQQLGFTGSVNSAFSSDRAWTARSTKMTNVSSGDTTIQVSGATRKFLDPAEVRASRSAMVVRYWENLSDLDSNGLALVEPLNLLTRDQMKSGDIYAVQIGSTVIIVDSVRDDSHRAVLGKVLKLIPGALHLRYCSNLRSLAHRREYQQAIGQ